MKTLKSSTLLLLLSLLPACGQQLVEFPNPANPANLAPTVTSVTPANATPGVAINRKVTATFSEPMSSATITAPGTFTVTGPFVTPVTGTVTYDEPSRTATFAPTPSGNLSINTTYTATISTGAKNPAGTALASPFVWSFSTAVTTDTTAPLVSFTAPASGDTGVAINWKIVATFNEAMDPATIIAANVTVTGPSGSVSGAVTYAAGSFAATFSPASNLATSATYTVTIKGITGVKDLADNPMAANYVWSFKTGTTSDTTAPKVSSTNPVDVATTVPIDKKISATFTKPMDPLTIITANFTLTDGVNPVMGTVSYDVPSNIATFSPLSPLAFSTKYTALVTTGATDLAGNALASGLMPNPWTFTTGTGLAPGAVNLRSLSTFVVVAGAGLTNSNSSGTTTLNGNVGLCPTATCQGDGSPCAATNPVINGTLYANDPAGVAAQAKVDLTAAYVDAMSQPVGTTVNDISGMVLLPGVYTSNSTMSIAVGGTVTLDGQGDANAVWIFQIGSSLTVNNNAKLLLINGAKAKNVFWAVFASSTLGSNVSFQGSILAGASNSVGTESVVVGRLLCTTGQITLLSNTITLPPL